MSGYVLGGICLWLFMYIILIIAPVRLSRKQILGFWYILIALLGILAYNAEPSVSDDLYRHFQLIDMARYGSDLSGTYAEQMLLFRGMIIFSSFFSNNGVLPFITVIIWGLLVGAIMKSYMKNNSYTTKTILLYFMVVLGGCSVFYLISGIRTALVAAIWVYAYCNLYLHGRKKSYYVIVIITCTLHYIGLILLGCQLVYHILNKHNKLWSKVALFGFLILLSILVNTPLLSNLLSGINTLYTKELSNKILGYMARTPLINAELILRITMLFVCLICGLYLNKKQPNKTNDFMVFLCLCTLAGSGISIIYERVPYVIAIIFLPTLCPIVKIVSARYRVVLYYGLCLFFIFQAVFLFYAMLAYISFDGVNFQQLLHSLF